MKASLEDYTTKGLRANALVLQCTVKMIREHPNENMRRKYSRGVREEDLEVEFPRFMGFSFNIYENKLRACFHSAKTMGKHYVMRDGKPRVHYFPLGLDEEGLIRHDGCQNCVRP